MADHALAGREAGRSTSGIEVGGMRRRTRPSVGAEEHAVLRIAKPDLANVPAEV